MGQQGGGTQVKVDATRVGIDFLVLLNDFNFRGDVFFPT